MDNATVTTYELNALIGKRAAEKPEFLAALLSDPRQALAAELGIVTPEQIKIEIHQESKNIMHLIVPASDSDTLELTDDELDQVAGGVSRGAVPSGYCVAYGVPGSWNVPGKHIK